MNLKTLDSISFYAKVMSLKDLEHNWIKAVFSPKWIENDGGLDVALFFGESIELDTVWERYAFYTSDLKYSESYGNFEDGYDLPNDAVGPLLESLEYIKFVSGIHQILLDSIQFYGVQETE
jgi:hypothetical protein